MRDAPTAWDSPEDGQQKPLLRRKPLAEAQPPIPPPRVDLRTDMVPARNPHISPRQLGLLLPSSQMRYWHPIFITRSVRIYVRWQSPQLTRLRVG